MTDTFNDPMNDPRPGSPPGPDKRPPDGKPKPKWKRFRPAIRVTGGIALLLIGLAGGTALGRLSRPAVEMAPVEPVAISALPPTGLVTVKGQVTDVYGKNFVIQDATAHTLVDAGPGAPTGAVTKNETLVVQGRIADGTLHASYIVHPDGHIDAVGPAGPPHGPGGPGGPGGPHPGPHWWHRLF